MISLITIVILLACVVLAFFVLVQLPKGGGLSGTFGSISSQVMGVKQSSDVREKGTWATIGVIAALCVVCVMFYERPKNLEGKATKASTSQQAPAKKSK
jgi:preprotein translocase subunit SecG